jgi:hypothetical protein
LKELFINHGYTPKLVMNWKNWNQQVWVACLVCSSDTGAIHSPIKNEKGAVQSMVWQCCYNDLSQTLAQKICYHAVVLSTLKVPLSGWWPQDGSEQWPLSDITGTQEGFLHFVTNHTDYSLDIIVFCVPVACIWQSSWPQEAWSEVQNLSQVTIMWHGTCQVQVLAW